MEIQQDQYTCAGMWVKQMSCSVEHQLKLRNLLPDFGTQVDRVSVTPQEGLMEFGLIEGKFSDFSKFRKSGKSLKHELG